MGSAASIDDGDVPEGLREAVSGLKDSPNNVMINELTILTDTTRNLAYIGDESVGVVSQLVHHLKENIHNSEDSLISPICQILRNLARKDDNQKYLGSAKLGLIEVLCNLIANNQISADIRSTCLSIFHLLSENEENFTRFIHIEGLLPLLVDELRSHPNNERLEVLYTLQAISSVKDNQASLLAESLKLIPVLLKGITENENNSAGIESMKLLRLFFANSANAEMLGSESLGIIAYLVKIAQHDAACESTTVAMDILWECASYPYNHEYFASPSLHLIELFMNKALIDKGYPRVKSVRAIWTIVTHVSTLDWVASEELSLIPVLMKIVQIDSGQAVTSAFNTLIFISFRCHNDAYITSSELGLITLFHNIFTGVEFSGRVEVFKSLLQTVVSRHVDLNVWKGFCLQEYLQEILNSDQKSKIVLCTFLWNLLEHSHEDVAIEVNKHKLYVTMIDLIREAGPVKSAWDTSGYVSKAVNFIMCFAKYESTRDGLRSIGAIELFEKINTGKNNGSEALKAMIILCYLSGRDESVDETHRCLIYEHGEIKSQLHSILDTVLQNKNGENFSIGTFTIKHLVYAYLALSQSASNRKLLNIGPVCDLLLKVFEMYFHHSSPLPYCGGGGHDVDSADATIQTLYNLLFIDSTPDSVDGEKNLEFMIDTQSYIRQMMSEEGQIQYAKLNTRTKEVIGLIDAFSEKAPSIQTASQKLRVRAKAEISYSHRPVYVSSLSQARLEQLKEDEDTED